MTHSGRRRPRIRPRHALVVLYLAAVLGVVLVFVAHRVYVHHASFASRQFFFLGDLYCADADIGFRMAPQRRGFAVLQGGLADPQRRIPYRTDTLGFRIPLDGAARPAAPGGLAGIGCSCTFGHGVAADSTWVVMAGRNLRLPVANLGVCAYSAVTSVELLRKHIHVLQPRLIVYAFGNFHLQRSRQAQFNKLHQVYLRNEGGHAHLQRPHFRNDLLDRLAPAIERQYDLAKLEGTPLRFDASKLRVTLPLALQDLGRALHPRTWRLRLRREPAVSDTLLARWVTTELLRMARPHGARVVLLFFPAFYAEAPGPGWLDVARSLEGQADFLFVDSSPRLFRQVSDRLRYERRFQIPDDGHPNARMHAEMAAALLEALDP